MASRTVSKVEALAERVRAAGGEALAIACDVTREEDIVRCVEATVAAHGRIDALAPFNLRGSRWYWSEVKPAICLCLISWETRVVKASLGVMQTRRRESRRSTGDGNVIFE